MIMKLSFRKLIVYLLPISLSLFSCSKDNESETIIKFWAMGAEAEYVTKLVPEFEKLNPGIKVKVQQVPWTAAQEKLEQLLQAIILLMPASLGIHGFHSFLL